MRSYVIRPLQAALLPFAALAFAALPSAAQIRGFSDARAETQAFCEARLQELPSPEAFREHLRTVTQEPHPTGSEAQGRVADYLVAAMDAAGFEVERHSYDVYLPALGGEVFAEIETPVRKRLNNREPAVPGDPFSSHPDLLPGWNAYSGSGDVRAQIVYANFGRKEDFEQLQEMGISVTDKIVVARYGGNFRGFKAKFAEAAGALGLIMFNDPGTGDGAEYPAGPMMNENTIQRGSVLTLDWTGDPLTPFEPAYPVESGKSVSRLDPEDLPLHTIPVLPLGYGAAAEILRLMEGQEAPADWRGGIDAPYRLEGGEGLTLRIHVDQPKKLVRATNVVGTLEGSDLPDEWIILGSHYDAWGFGALDPNGGTAMLLTLAEALGQLDQEGCGPRRTIKIAHWDAEEYGIIGSVEWVEEFRDQLRAKAVAYINADGAVTGGNVRVSASPSLKRTIVEATQAVAYPDGRSMYLAWNSDRLDEPAIGDLGGGSDHVGFYTHAGVPSGGVSMSGASGVYHSNYDDFAFFERFSDPEFVYGPALARVDGIVALRLANADILPYDLVRYPTDIDRHIGAMESRAGELGVNLKLDRLKAATDVLSEVAAELELSLFSEGSRIYDPAADRNAANRGLLDMEKAFIRSEGLQGRPWSQSLFASPDPFSGYASWMLPGLRFEVESRSAAGITEWEGTYVIAVQDLTRRMRALTNQVTERRAEGASLVAPDGTVEWDRYHRWQDVHAIMKTWSEMYPGLTELYSIGESYEGVDLMLMEVTNEATGPASEKPAIYLDGGIHAAELTGSEVALYTLGQLLNGYGSDDAITELLDARAFYIRPKFNPDGSNLVLDTDQSLRSSVHPVDQDYDGVADEDPGEDLDGDGRILQMRIPDPDGDQMISPDDPRIMIDRESGATGPFYRVVSEGIDNDGDGRLNEDGYGGLDMNRNFPRNWERQHLQSGAGDFPLSEPETYATAKFINEHRNVAFIFHGHTSGGFVYRLPSASAPSQFDRTDLALIEDLSAFYTESTGREVIPSATHPTEHRYGTLITFGYWDHGVVGWVPEFSPGPDEWVPDTDGDGSIEESDWHALNDGSFGGRYFGDWTRYDHPEFGVVEIGGWHRKYWGQNPPNELLERELEQQVPWFLHVANRTPLLGLSQPRISALGGGRFRVEATVTNVGDLPTHLTQRGFEGREATDGSVTQQVVAPPTATLEVEGGRIVEGGDTPTPTGRITLSHLAGTGTITDKVSARSQTVAWVVESTSADALVRITAEAQKGGTVRSGASVLR